MDIEVEKEALLVLIDVFQTQRIFDNLLENSIKHSQTDDLKINIYLKRDKENAIIIFKDNGNGVEQDILPFIFDEFFCGDLSRKEKNGTGLGLHISKSIIESMHGKIDAENNKGFTVTVTFPIEEVRIQM